MKKESANYVRTIVALSFFIACVGCATDSYTVGKEVNLNVGSLQELIDKNIYSGGSIYQAKYSTRWVGVGNSVYAHDSKGYALWNGSELVKQLAKPRAILDAYCVANGGVLDPVALPGGLEKVFIPGMSTGSSQKYLKYLGTYKCRSGDSILWAVDLSFRGSAVNTGIKRMPIGSDYEYYSVEILVKEVSIGGKGLGLCQSQELEEIRIKAEALSKEITITVDKVVDESGLYTREPFRARTYAKIIGENCPRDLANVSFQVTPVPDSGNAGYYSFDYKPAEFIVTANEVLNRGQVTLQSTVFVKAKRFSRAPLNTTFQNSDLAIRLTELPGNGSIRFTLENRSGKYMTISAISIHHGGRVDTQQDMNRELPPMTETPVTIPGIRLYSVDSVFNTYWTKGDFDRAKLDLALSVKYKTTGGERTLFEKKQIRLADIVPR